tara:strand:+ start:1829 stop:2305 length:477 start_codon:yes stop_codon:yes gene_type:complete
MSNEKKYKIKIRYCTGNSLYCDDEEDYLELDWNNLSIAKENLQYIKQHYLQYKESQSYSFRKSKRTEQELFEENKSKPWFVKEVVPVDKHGSVTTQEEAIKRGYTETKINNYLAMKCIKLKADNGEFMQISAFWIGYFEKLYGADIITDESDMYFNIK